MIVCEYYKDMPVGFELNEDDINHLREEFQKTTGKTVEQWLEWFYKELGGEPRDAEETQLQFDASFLANTE